MLRLIMAFSIILGMPAMWSSYLMNVDLWTLGAVDEGTSTRKVTSVKPWEPSFWDNVLTALAIRQSGKKIVAIGWCGGTNTRPQWSEPVWLKPHGIVSWKQNVRAEIWLYRYGGWKRYNETRAENGQKATIKGLHFCNPRDEGQVTELRLYWGK